MVTVGTALFLNESNIETTALLAQAEPLRLEGQTVMFAAIDGKPAGLLGVADPVKSTTPEAIDLLAQGRSANRDADRRQSDDRGGGGTAATYR